MSQDENIGKVSSDQAGAWGYEFPAEMVAEELIAAQVEDINSRTDLDGDTKHALIVAMGGMSRVKMAAILTKYFSTPGTVSS